MECFSGLHGVLPAVPDISHQQNLPVTEHPAAGWPLYESRLKGKLHVISKRYTQRIERHNLNLRQHLARLGRKSLSFSKSVELYDKVIGHYLNIKHYQ